MGLLGKLRRQHMLHTKLRPFEKENAARQFSADDTISLFVNPRGGSTWLAELLLHIPRTVVAIEPLFRGRFSTVDPSPPGHKKGLEEVRDLGFWFYQHVPDDAAWPGAKAFMHRLFNRQKMALSIWYQNELAEIPSASTFLFKLCYGQLMLPWLADQFDMKNVLLVRHPCAVVASQLNFGEAWARIKEHPQFPVPQCKFNEIFERHHEALAAVHTPAENLAAMWAVTMRNTIYHPNNNKKWLTVSYEHLLCEPEKQLIRICEYLGREVPETALEQIKRPSKTSSDGVIASDQLSKWKTDLSEDQIRRILAMIERFDIDLYTRSEFPQESILYGSP